MRRRLTWLGVVAGLAALVVGTLVAVSAPQKASAISGSSFNPGLIMSDQVFYDGASMSASSAQAFIASKGASCVAGAEPCLKDYRLSYGAISSSSYCSAMSAASSQLASATIVAIGKACGVSPKVLIVLLEKEQGLVTGTRKSANAYNYATGFACPDTAPCSSASSGFFKQVYAAAMQFRIYRAYPNNFNYVAGKTVNILYNPNSSCGTKAVHIQNQATAGLYDYTPYVPNAAALSNLTGIGDSCSSYGNRNFWYDYSAWFGSTTNAATNGSVDSFAPVSGTNLLAFKGWAFDGANKTKSINVSVELTGPSGLIGTTSYLADGTRADVGSSIAGIGSRHGFGGAFSVTAAGTYQACFSAQWSAGSVLLGCSTATMGALVANSPNIAGAYDTNQPDFSTPRLHERGWAFDKTAPTTSTSVTIVAVDPAGRISRTTAAANVARADVNKAYPSTGSTSVGFDTYIPISDAGVYMVCAVASTAGASDKGGFSVLGCKTAQFGPSSPTGSFDTAAVSFSRDGTSVQAHIRGWAIDRADPTESTRMDLYISKSDGTSVTAQRLLASTTRNDVAAAYSGAGAAHGLDTEVPLPGAGTYSACLYADGMPALGTVQLLACKAFTVAPSSPKGSLDTVTSAKSGSQTTLTVRGWSIDFAAPASTARMDVYVRDPSGSNIGYRVPATAARSDLARVYPAAGANHGLEFSLPVTKTGTYQVCAWADGLAALGSPVLSVGCKSITVH